MTSRPALVLLPGMLCDRAYYEPQLPELQRCTEVSVASYPLATSIAEMAQRVLREAPPRFAVAGHSMGGRVAQEILARAPERVLGVGLFGTDYRGPGSAEQHSREEAQRRDWLALVDREGFERFARQWALPLVASRRQSDRALIDRIVQMAARFGREGLDAHCRAGLSRPDYGSLLPGIGVPALVIAGSEDRLRTPQLHRQIAQRIPNARLVIIEGAGHMMSMEEPAAVTAAMLPWLAGLQP